MEFPELKDQHIDQTRYEPNRKLKRERELKGWAQGDVAEKVGSQPNLVTRWERGYAFPSPLEEKDKSVSMQAQPLVHQEEKRRFFPRRTVIIGLGSGIRAGGIAGGIWWQMLARHVNPLIYTYHTHPPTAVNDVKWSPRGTSIACVNGDTTVQILNATTGSVTMTCRGHAHDVCWSYQRCLDGGMVSR